MLFEVERAVLDELQRADRRQDLGGAADLAPRIRLHRRGGRHVGVSVAFRPDQPAALRDRDGGAGQVVLRQVLPHDGVDLGELTRSLATDRDGCGTAIEITSGEEGRAGQDER